MNKRQVVTESICGLLIMLFLYASVSKFLDFHRFVSEMNNQPFPVRYTPYLVWAIPGLEIAISVALIFERSRTAGLYASLILMSLFTIYTGSILLHFFNYVPCSCGGVIRKLTWGQHLVFNLFFVGLSVTGHFFQRWKRYQTITVNKKIKNSFV